VIEKRIRFDVN